ncbi:LysM domain-containing protein [Desulfuromonas sp.]|uniref:LysM peptidoglycan-binding domain-containing protein n=1 Tax=Desulfuromonas sp. TaxID=892 RepID=UPI0025B807E6|nr:LysM domain-containing protein [Desulfuromonas sp.]
MIWPRLLLFLCLLLLPLTSLAQAPLQTYVIKKGDTLWGISERFINDPDYWPNLWSHNPFITNPHFIYPGQKVLIYDGRLEIVPARPEAAPDEPEARPAPPAPEKGQSVTIKTFGGSEGFVTRAEVASAGTLIDTVDNRLLMAEGDKVFLDMENLASVAPGDEFTLFEVGKEVKHPLTDAPLGFQVVTLGTVRITALDPSVATGVITDSFLEIQRGARLMPLRAPVREVELKSAARPILGTLIGARGNQILLGQHDLAYVDLGTRDGLEAGNMLYISRPRTASEFGLQGEEIQLPDVLLGGAVVLEAGQESASVLILKAAGPLYRGDRVTTVTP